VRRVAHEGDGGGHLVGHRVLGSRDVALLHVAAHRLDLLRKATLRQHAAVERQRGVARQHPLGLVQAGRTVVAEVGGREVTDLERLWIAAAPRGAPVQHRHRAPVTLEGEEVEDDAVGQLAGQLDHRLHQRRGEDPGRRARTGLVRALRPGRPQRGDDVTGLGQRVAHVDAERRVHRPVPDAEAEQQAATGELLDRRRLLREQARMAEIDVGDGSADVQPSGRRGNGMRVRQRVVERLGNEDGREAERLGTTRPGEDVLWRSVPQRGEGDGDAIHPSSLDHERRLWEAAVAAGRAGG
jgi:hypothetical protein